MKPRLTLPERIMNAHTPLQIVSGDFPNMMIKGYELTIYVSKENIDLYKNQLTDYFDYGHDGYRVGGFIVKLKALEEQP